MFLLLNCKINFRLIHLTFYFLIIVQQPFKGHHTFKGIILSASTRLYFCSLKYPTFPLLDLFALSYIFLLVKGIHCLPMQYCPFEKAL